MMKTKYTILFAALIFLVAANIFTGSADVSIGDVAGVLTGGKTTETIRYIVLYCRVPQTVTALLTGASLSVAGLLLQTAFHNPLAGPSVLGISGGAALGVAIVALCGLTGTLSAVSAAAAGAVGVTLLLLFLSSLLRNNVVLLITGLLLGYLISAVITILNVCASAEGMRGYILWGMGDFAGVGMERLAGYGSALAVLVFLAVLMIKPMNTLQLGDMYAANLGLNIRSLRSALLLVVGGITALTTAFCGPVAFIGLAVPHIARLFVRTSNYRTLLPVTLLTGGITALVCTLLCVALPRQPLPVNAVTPLVGVPVITYIIIKRRY
ncbi:MAG: iron ABC transporter permease [Prevotella sp.]|nr:iron ABC transporter permease [Prevotella sp.]